MNERMNDSRLKWVACRNQGKLSEIVHQATYATLTVNSSANCYGFPKVCVCVCVCVCIYIYIYIVAKYIGDNGNV